MKTEQKLKGNIRVNGDTTENFVDQLYWEEVQEILDTI